MRQKLILALFVMFAVLTASQFLAAQNTKPGQPGSSIVTQVGDPKPYNYDPPLTHYDAPSQTATACASGCVRRSSPFNPPKAGDSTFVVDCDTGLDTGCTFRSGGPLVFTIKVCRVVGDVQKLKSAGLISETARLDLPAFDVDFFAVVPPFNPERDRVFFNGHRMDEYPGNSQFLTGDNNIWKLNSFRIPIEWINFPTDPGPGGTPTPADNTIRIDIDTANTAELWCTAVDWAALSIDAARPAVFVHGILSNGGAWNKPEFSWVNKLNFLGLPNSNRLNMGDLDSIQNNSAKISAEVANATQRWGVDKVNLICHSKGGIDSRHFAEGNDSVEQVIQLGTPNAGSPLADVAQGISTGLIGPIGTAIVNALVTPAGKQLTTNYMQYYNDHHGSNPKVKYTALAGIYDPDCTFFPFCAHAGEQFLLFITGPGDTIVPVSSVHSLGYTDNRFFSSVGNDKQSTHTNLNDSQGVFDRVSDRVKAFGTPLKPITTLPAVGRTVSALGSISQGQVQTKTIQIDQAGPTSFSILFPSGNLDLALISPSGQRFDPVTIIGNPNVSRQELEILGGLVEVYNFASAEAGTWTAEITAPSVIDPSGSVTYALIGWLQNPTVTFDGSFARANIHAGESLRLLGTLKDNGAPVVGASVLGKVGLPDATTQTVVLHDDGLGGDQTANDGIYTGDLTATSQPGDYRVLFTASRPAAPSINREVFALATVSRSSSTLTGKFSDAGQDTNGNGLFDNLTVSVGVNVTTAATYRVFGVLTDALGNTHQANVQSALGTGMNTVSLRFDGPPFFNNRVDGPYRLTTIRLAEDSNGDIMPVDERSNAFQTAAYSFRDFEHGPLVLTGNGSAVGIDTNGNGLFDILRVGLDIDVSTAGAYDWSARLADRNGKEIGFVTSSGSLIVGINTLQLNYSGSAIGTNGVDGPYFVESLLVFGPGGSLVVPNAFTTGPFQATQFEGACSITCPPNITKANDLGQCGAVVNYASPTIAGSCGTVTCNPPAGSFFPVGTTAVHCTTSTGASCSFTVAIQDAEQPKITCPTNVTAMTQRPGDVSITVSFAQPVASDNCPGLTVTCAPPSGSVFSVGTTTVTCKATDASNNMVTCNFTVTVFDVRLQDESNPNTVLIFISAGAEVGKYRFCAPGNTYSGIGEVSRKGSIFTLVHNPSDRRVLGRVDAAASAGTASIQSPPGRTIAVITDRDIRNDTSICP